MSRSRAIQAAEVLALCAVALAVRLIELDHPPHPDELLHLLAARSLLEDGTLRVTEVAQPYTRAWMFTYLIAGLFAVFGESLEVARLPAVFGGTVLVGALFLAVRAVAGRTAAWIAGLLLCFYPVMLYHSQLARFYTVHALLFFVGASAVYLFLDEERRGARLGLLIIAGGTLGLALHLQITTLVGLAGIGLGAAVLGGPATARQWVAHRRRWWIAGAVLVVAALSLVVVWRSPVALRIADLFGYADLWAEEHRFAVRFYHWRLLDHYPTLWTLFPLSVLLAVAVARRPALWATSIFAVAFLFHSTAAWKDERYLLYTMPMFFGISGVAAAELARLTRPLIERLLAGGRGDRLADRVAAPLASALLLAAGLFAAASNGAFSYTVRMLLPPPAEGAHRMYRGDTDWGAASRRLRALADSAELVISSADVKSVYYVGRLDATLTATLLWGRDGRRPEFNASPQTGRPTISTPGSLALLRDCASSGLVVIDRDHWRISWGVADPVADYLEANTERVPLLESDGVIVFRWREPATWKPRPCPPSIITAGLR